MASASIDPGMLRRIMAHAFTSVVRTNDTVAFEEIATRFKEDPRGRAAMMTLIHKHSPDKVRDLKRLDALGALDAVELLEFCVDRSDTAPYEGVFFRRTHYGPLIQLIEKDKRDVVARFLDLASDDTLEGVVAGVCRNINRTVLKDMLLPLMADWPVPLLQKVLPDAVISGAQDIAMMCIDHGADPRRCILDMVRYEAYRPSQERARDIGDFLLSVTRADIPGIVDDLAFDSADHDATGFWNSEIEPEEYDPDDYALFLHIVSRCKEAVNWQVLYKSFEHSEVLARNVVASARMTGSELGGLAAAFAADARAMVQNAANLQRRGTPMQYVLHNNHGTYMYCDSCMFNIIHNMDPIRQFEAFLKELSSELSYLCLASVSDGRKTNKRQREE